MYDAFSNDYDRFVNWTGRLNFELPLIERQLRALKPEHGVVRVLDAACGTGMHAIALAQKGYLAAGADFSAGMVARARANAQAAGVQVPFIQAGFGQLVEAFRSEEHGLLPFDQC
jgi:glycine/sarcosine N-methyltransferase